MQQGTDDFEALAKTFPLVPAELAIALPIAEFDDDGNGDGAFLAGSSG